MMNSFNYLSILISIVLALGITRVLRNLGEMFRRVRIIIFLLGPRRLGREPFHFSGHRHRRFLYGWRNQEPSTFSFFVFVLISPTILFLAALLLFPREGVPDDSSITKCTFTRIIARSYDHGTLR